MVQAGTNETATPAGNLFTYTSVIWVEWLPNSWTQYQGFPLTPGDGMTVSLAVTGTGSGATATAQFLEAAPMGYGVASKYVTIPAPSGRNFHGNSAEWIVEDPNLCSPLTCDLLNYSKIYMSFMYYNNRNNGCYNYNEARTPGTLTWITMKDSGGFSLSTPSAISSNQALFTWNYYW